jgi:hypothetical protein
MRYSQLLRASLRMAIIVLAPHLPVQAQHSPSWLEVGENLTVRSLALNGAGELFIVGQGSFQAGVGLGGQTYSGHSETSALLALLGPDNDVRWIKQGAFRGRMEENAIGGDLLQGFLGAIDALGNFYTSEGYPHVADAGMLAQGGVSINKYDPAGDPLWSIPVHPPAMHFDEQPAFVAGLGVDADGNTYIAGNFRDTLLLAGDTLVATPSETTFPTSDVFMASISPDGALRWSRRLGGAADEDMIGGFDDGAFAVDEAGNMYLAGYFAGGTVFDDGPVTDPIQSTMYPIVSYDPEGRVRWVRTQADFGIGENAAPVRLAVTVGGEVYAVWSYWELDGQLDVTVGDQTFRDPGSGGSFLTRLTADGVLAWARPLTSDGNQIVLSMAVDARDRVCVAGYFDGLYLRLGNRELRKANLQADKTDGFIGCYSAEGDLLSTIHAAGPNWQKIRAIALSGTGELYLAGSFTDELRLGTELRTHAGNTAFFARFDAATVTSTERPDAEPAGVTRLEAYPNPAGQSATIRYHLEVAGPVRLAVYDVLGREVAVLADAVQEAGVHEAVFDTAGLPAGVYSYRLRADRFAASGTLLHVR